MSFLVRGITTVVLVVAAAGCHRAHGSDLDAAIDADVPDGPSSDASPLDGDFDAARRDGGVGPDAGTCAHPPSGWGRASFSTDGSWTGVRLARDGESTWLVLTPADGGALRAMRLDPTSPMPFGSGLVPLEGTEGTTALAVAGDDFRIATLASSRLLFVHDASGALMSREGVAARPLEGSTIALRDVRIGVVVPVESGLHVGVHDVAGGSPIWSTTLEGWSHGAIGRGRGLFAFLASDESMTTSYWGLDELGAIRADSLSTFFQAPRADGSTFVGVTPSTIAVRYAGGRIEERATPPMVRRLTPPTVADGPTWTALAIGSDAGVWLSLDASAEWMVLDELATVPLALADQGWARVGAFFLDGERVRWEGLSCAEP